MWVFWCLVGKFYISVMICFNVIIYNGLFLSVLLFVQFDEFGGDIGCVEMNQLVLFDFECIVLCVYVCVLFCVSSGFGIVDQGSNVISVNGVQFGKGWEVVIKLGDSFQIGGYMLIVEVVVVIGVVSDLFVDFFGLVFV